MSEQFVLPANGMSEEQWINHKRSHAEDVIRFWQRFAPNMTWDNIIGYAAITPYDVANGLPNMGPEGCWAVIDNIPGQIGKFRPVPELARHRTPIKNLYATGSAWHPVGCGSSWQGYNCYKIIAEDLDLVKPWEGMPW
jgi:beta-carotene ketolase (CrtO type)